MTGMYRDVCGKSIRQIVNVISVSEDTAYNMIRMTAMLMDLPMDDEKVVRMILDDCGLTAEIA